MRNTISENIAEHSLDVAIIAHALAVIRNTYFGGNVNAERVAVLAIFHDTAEIITGDLPTPVKYFAPEIKKAYKQVELAAKDQLLHAIDEEMRDIYKKILDSKEKELLELVKAADKLSALIKCIEEKRMGNQDFKEAESTTMKAIMSMNIPEADYFMEHYLPAYSLTLDEQA